MGTNTSEIFSYLETLSPLNFQESYDNCGLQVGLSDVSVDKVLVCLDVTEQIVNEAERLGCGLIISHHPLIFRGLKHVGDKTYQERCVVRAIRSGISIYSSHTCLDNAPGGVNHKIASLLGLQQLDWLSPAPSGGHGSGVVGYLPQSISDVDFLSLLQQIFGVKCLRHSATNGRMISKVALCGGAGAFLLKDAIASGADCFISGEFHYHDYFENDGLLLAELGHYQSEQYTCELLSDMLKEAFPELEVIVTEINTNPIQYTVYSK